MSILHQNARLGMAVEGGNVIQFSGSCCRSGMVPLAFGTITMGLAQGLRDGSMTPNFSIFWISSSLAGRRASGIDKLAAVPTKSRRGANFMLESQKSALGSHWTHLKTDWPGSPVQVSSGSISTTGGWLWAKAASCSGRAVHFLRMLIW